MKILGFDCSGPIITVGLCESNKTVGRWDMPSQRRKGNSLEELIDRALADMGWSRSTIDGLALATGPGSLTALRIGWATASGWAMAGGFPVMGWNVPEIQRRYWSESKDGEAGPAGLKSPFSCLIHHRGSEFYRYSLLTSRLIVQPDVLSLDRVPAKNVSERWIGGPGVIGHRHDWARVFGANVRLVSDEHAIVGGDHIAQWGHAALKSGESLTLDEAPLDYGLPPQFKKHKSL